jgi:hypothetical protein
MAHATSMYDAPGEIVPKHCAVFPRRQSSPKVVLSQLAAVLSLVGGVEGNIVNGRAAIGMSANLPESAGRRE